MLTNLESLPVQRIHNMLKMFVPASGGDRGYDCSEQARRRFGRTATERGLHAEQRERLGGQGVARRGKAWQGRGKGVARGWRNASRCHFLTFR